jgi:asparagine synthase (glutamine-hydrolysing)
VPGPIESLPRDTRSAREEFFDLFSDAVSIRLRSDAPVGVFLSGGMDSSSILAASSALPARERGGFAGKTISLAYPDAPEIDESGYAWTMARRTNCEPEFVVPDAAGLEAEMDELARTLDDLTFHHGFYAMKLLSRRAREEGIRVVLTGQGGDELLGGYEPWDVHLRELWSGGRSVRAIGEAFLSGRRFWGTARALRRLPGNLRAARSSRPLDAFCSARPTLQGHLRHQFLLDRLPFVLRFEDRVTMAHGVESRQPFLDHRVVEFLWRVPGDWLLRNGQTKWLLRRAMKARLPREILRRPAKLATPGPRRRFSAEAVERARLAYRRFTANGWLDAAAPTESEMIDSEYALFRLMIAEAWSRLCLGADAA